jgi:START-like superfamily domain
MSPKSLYLRVILSLLKKNMAKKEKFILEFPIRCSPHILFEFLSTSNGLGEWFADKVEDEGNVFVFRWGNSKETAILIHKEVDKVAKFRWDNEDKTEYFEFKIERNDVTNETVLFVTDFAEKTELKGQTALWESQIHELKHRIGS